ncbi:MAG: S41 family peptidase [Chloroflexi bacterium]|nr:MAG: S41 family peptidase [Chloroflexota bacterium]
MIKTSRALALGTLVAGLVAILAFVGGVAVALRWGGTLPLVATLAPTVPANTTPAKAANDFKVFWEVWELIDTQFYHKEPLNYRKMTYGAIEGMLKSLGDDYTGFDEPVNAAARQERLSGQFEGIGAYVEFKDGKLLIVAPIEESPAEKAGLLAGDQVLKVDGQDMAPQLDGLDPAEAAAKAASIIRGPKGTPVVLTVFRADTNETRDFTINRDAIPLISVRTKMLAGKIAYVQVSEFKETTTAELDKALTTVLEQQPAGLILDLRNNPGGYLNTAREMLGRFVADGVALQEEFSDGSRSNLDTLNNGGPRVLDLPMVVLTNGGSASASEIVVGGLRDHKRATLLGEKTFGKGSVQALKQLSDKSSARITIARWLTPNGDQIHQKGIEPHVYVPLQQEEQYRVDLPQRRPSDLANVNDSQLWWAIKTLTTNERPAFPTPTPTVAADDTSAAPPEATPAEPTATATP